MAVAFGSATNVLEATRTNTTYTAPSGIADGDLLLIWHFEFLGTGRPTPTPPTGFATIPNVTWPLTAGQTTYGTWLWFKIASSESGNYTVTHASCVSRGIIARATGNDTTTPFSPNPTGASATTGSSTSTFTGLTTTVDNTLIMAFMADDNDLGANLSPPSGTTPTFTERVDDNHGEYLASGIMSPAGATGSKTMTNNSGAGTPWFAVLVAVAPSSAAPSLTAASASVSQTSATVTIPPITNAPETLIVVQSPRFH